MTCQLCHREVEEYSIHHLVPRSNNGSHSDKVVLCLACHRMVHRLFTNKELARKYYTLNRLRQNREIRKFVDWVKKQDPNRRIKIS
ncbi:MAG: HNH endonuclease [Calditrichia bacterium]